jgi:hypothetical protein
MMTKDFKDLLQASGREQDLLDVKALRNAAKVAPKREQLKRPSNNE